MKPRRKSSASSSKRLAEPQTPAKRPARGPARSPATPRPPAASAAKKVQRASPSPRPDEMTEEVMEFIAAIDDYKRAHQRPFPTWSEVLEILKRLGYRRAG